MPLPVTPLYQPLPIDPSPLITLMDQGYVQETLQAALTLNMFTKLQTAKTAADLAADESWDQETTSRLLEVLLHTGCLVRSGTAYQASLLAAAYLIPDSFLYYGDKFCEPLETGSYGSDLIRCLRQEPDTRITPEPHWTPERLRQMGAYALSGYIQNTVSRCDLTQAKHLLDLGGGHGFFSIAFAQKYPDLHVTLFDLPVIASMAGEIMNQFNLGERCHTLNGNFLHDPIGGPYDAILCSNILHKDKRDIVLPKVYEALNPGGMLILRCRIADCPANLTTALSKLYWQVRGGKDLYTAEQWQGFVTPYGFSEFTLLGVDDIFATFTARRN